MTTHRAQARYVLLKVGLPTERGNTLECRRKVFMGCQGVSASEMTYIVSGVALNSNHLPMGCHEAPKSVRPVAFFCIANRALYREGTMDEEDDSRLGHSHYEDIDVLDPTISTARRSTLPVSCDDLYLDPRHPDAAASGRSSTLLNRGNTNRSDRYGCVSYRRALVKCVDVGSGDQCSRKRVQRLKKVKRT